MNTLRVRPSNPILAVASLISAMIMVALWVQMRAPEQVMTRESGVGIVPYELAFTPGRAQEILVSWGPEGREAARHSLLVDFGFIPAYALSLAGITLLTARAQQGWGQTIGFMLAIGCMAAALFDVLENLMLLSMLNDPSVPVLTPLLAGLAASLKFLLLGLTILYWFCAWVWWLVKRGGRTS